MKIISTLQEVTNTGDTVIFEAEDGANIHITPDHAYHIVSVHDSLNKENQKTMRNMMENSEEDFIRVLTFCKEQFRKED